MTDRDRIIWEPAADQAAIGARPSMGRGAAQLAGARVAAVVGAALTSVVIARELGPAGSGSFALVIAFVGILAMVMMLGSELGFVWMVGGRRWTPGSALATARVAALALGTLGSAAGVAVYLVTAESVFEGIELQIVLPALAAVPLWLTWTYVSQIALGAEHYSVAARIPVVQVAATLVAVVPLTLAYGLVGAVVGFIVGQAVAAVASLAWSRALASGDRRRGLDLNRFRAALAFGARPYAANLLSAVVYRFDLFFLNAAAGTRQVGYYTVAFALTALVGLVPQALGAVLFPRLASLSAVGEPVDSVETKTLRHTTIAALAGAAAIAAGLVLLVEPIYGESFHAAIVPGLILLPGVAALAIAGSIFAALAGRGRPDCALTAMLVVAPLSVGLYLTLIPPFEASGAALASTISYLTSLLLACHFLRRVSGAPVLRRLLPGRGELADYRRLRPV